MDVDKDGTVTFAEWQDFNRYVAYERGCVRLAPRRFFLFFRASFSYADITVY